jgi:hypothetical protein
MVADISGQIKREKKGTGKEIAFRSVVFPF